MPPHLLPLLLLLTTTFISLSSTSRVLELSDRFLDIRKDGIWLIKFYAPWCGHCKKLEPIYAHVAQALSATPVRVARVDCTRFPSVGKEFGVDGYPTVMFVKPTSTHTYTGDRTASEMISYAKRMMGPAVREWQEEELEETSLVYRGERRGLWWEAFEKVANQNQHSVGFYIRGLEEGSEVGGGGGAEITLHHSGDTPPLKFNDQSEDVFNSLASFLAKNKFPKFVKATRNNFQDLLATKKLIVMGVVEEDKLGNLDKEQEEFLRFFEDFVRNFTVQDGAFESQYTYTATPTIANSIAMTTLPLPSILVINSTTYTHFILSHDISPASLDAFLHKIHQSELTPLGGSSLWTRLYRSYYELTTNLGLMFSGNPVLTVILFGLPFGFLSLICYSVFCGGAEVVEDGEEDVDHEKED